MPRPSTTCFAPPDLRQLHERRRIRRVRQIVGERAIVERVRIDRWRFVIQAGGRTVDDQIEMLGRNLVEVNCLHAELFGQLFGSLVRSIGDCQPTRTFIQHRAQQPADRATRPKYQHRTVGKRKLQAFAQVAHETDAIGVVTDDRVAVELQCVDSAGDSRARRQIIRQLRRVDLERQRDVQSAVSSFAQSQRLVFKAIERRFDALIGKVLLCLLRKSLMNLR